MQMTPDQHAREKIDSLLIAAGWVLQNNSDFDRNASEGVAVREFSLPNGPCDYLLFVGGKAAGIIEAKKLGSTLSGVAEQSAKYAAKLPEHRSSAISVIPNPGRAEYLHSINLTLCTHG